MHIRLQTAPAYQPLPTRAGDALDADIVRVWAEYQRTQATPTWAGFLAKLAARNRAMAIACDAVRDEIKNLPPPDKPLP